MPIDNPSNVNKEVKEGNPLKRSSSSSDSVLRNLKGDPSPVALNDSAMQIARKTSQEVLKRKTPEISEEQEIRKLNATEIKEVTAVLKKASNELGINTKTRDPLILNENVPLCIRNLHDYALNTIKGDSVSISAYRGALGELDKFLEDWEQVESVRNKLAEIKEREAAAKVEREAAK